MAETQLPGVSISVHKLAYSSFNATFDLHVPTIELFDVGKIDLEAFDRALELHLRFRLETEKMAPIEKIQCKAKVEIDIIRSTFPGLQNPVIIASMAASFYLLCTIDDLIENTSLNNGTRLLREMIDRLKGNTDLSFYHEQSYRKSISDGCYQNCSNTSCDNTFSIHVRSAVMSFQRHTRSILPVSTWVNCCSAIGDVLSAVIKEHEYRAHRKSDLSEYLKIRALTIGVEPFFRLLQSTKDQVSHNCVGSIMHLEQALGLISGLQNDIVGVEKDIKAGEWMNYARISSIRAYQLENVDPSMSAIAFGVKRAVDTHNAAIALAIEHWQAIVAQGNEQDVQVASTMLAFAGRHYRWASLAKRYKPCP